MANLYETFINIKLPKRVIKEILKFIPPEEIADIMKESKKREHIKGSSPKTLLALAGIMNIGGNALKDTEEIWNE